MKHSFWGLILVALGVVLLVQEIGNVNLGLEFWPVVLTIFGASLLWSSIRKWRFSWFKVALGLWVGSIGLFSILHNAGYSQIDGGDIASKGWPFLLIAIGLSAIFGRLRFGWRGEGLRDVRMVGDVRYGGGRWRLENDLRLEHGVGDVKIDLTTADITDGVHHVMVDAKIGEVLIRVPDNVSVVASGSVNVGDLQVFTDRHSGIGGLYSHQEVTVPDSPITLLVTAQLRIGKLWILREAPRTPRINE